jgi:hypothetical protein
MPTSSDNRADPLDPVRDAPPTLVGRDPERATLTQPVRDAEDGHPSVFGIRGPGAW